MLELGCGEGVNLMSIASAFPASTCVGVDSDPVAIGRARDLADAARLSNVGFTCADVREAASDLDQVDYVLVHGVWSWVLDDVKRAILRLCADNLAPHGVALISYNALPGWHLWQPARAIALAAQARAEPGVDAALAARDAVSLALRLHGDAEDLYGRVLSASVERYEHREPAVLEVDDLAPEMVPVSVREVAGAAAEAGLSYLGEALPEQWWQWRVSRGTADRLRSAVARDNVSRQHFADLASGAAFKASVFARAEASQLAEPDAARIGDCWAVARADRDPPPAGMAPATRNIAEALAEAWPRFVALEELAGKCSLSLESVARGTLGLVADSRADVYLDPPAYAVTVASHPEAPALSRAQALLGFEVSSLRHEQVRLEDEHARTLLALLDGSREHKSLVTELVARTGATTAAATEALEGYLSRLAEFGLLRDTGF